MTNPFEYEKEIDAIRARLYEKRQEDLKTMTPEELTRRDNAWLRELAKQYGWKVVPSASAARPAA